MGGICRFASHSGILQILPRRPLPPLPGLSLGGVDGWKGADLDGRALGGYRFNRMIISRYKINMPEIIKNRKEIHGMPKICGWMSVKLKMAEARSIAAVNRDRVRRLAMA